MTAPFKHFSPRLKLLFLFLMMLAAIILVSFITAVTGWIMFGNMQFDLSLFLDNAALVKFIQATQTILVFIVPSIIAAKLFWPERFNGLAETSNLSLNILLASVLTMVLSQVFIGWSGAFNSSIALPESWSALSAWIEKTEKEALELTSVLIQYDSGAGFFLNVILIAFLPALGEEWLFRGHVQRYFAEWFRNVHVAIFITAFVFSALHMQFMTFLPRFFLGLILGYLFYLGGNLWYSVAGHFTNNFLALLAMRGKDPVEALAVNKVENSVTVYVSVVISALSVMGLLFIISRVKQREKYRR